MKHEPKSDPHDTGAQRDAVEFESFVRELPLAAPSRQLDVRISRLLETSRPRGRVRAAMIGVAAMIAIVGGIVFSNRSRAPNRTAIAPPQIKSTPVANFSRPLRIERDASRLADGGIVGFAGRVPIRAFHVNGVRQIWYVDPEGKRLCVTVPSDRVVLVPVNTF